MASQPEKQVIAIHILSNISGNKGNKIMKFGNSIGCNMRNIYLEKSYTKYDGKTIPRLISKNLKLSVSLHQKSKVLYSLFLLYVKLGTIEIYWSEAVDHLLSPHATLFLKTKTKIGLELVSLPNFLYDFWRKHFSCYISLTGQI